MQPGLSYRAGPADLAVVLLSLLVYGFAAWTFLPTLGAWVMALALLPVVLAAWRSDQLIENRETYAIMEATPSIIPPLAIKPICTIVLLLPRRPC